MKNYKRESEYKINDLILERWSPRAFEPVEIPNEKLLSIFEAARFAPSAFNLQPWRFIYAKRETPEWDNLFSLLIDFNKSWVKNASAIGVIISRKNFEHNEKPAFTHQFDTGSAWGFLTLEAINQGYHTHGMAGFDYEKAKDLLAIPDEFQVLAMFAIGKLSEKSILPKELQEREEPADRKPLNEIIMNGKFIQ